jgi:hypothetical protein
VTFWSIAENSLTGVSGSATATFVYDGDSNSVKGTVGGVTMAYIGTNADARALRQRVDPLRVSVSAFAHLPIPLLSYFACQRIMPMVLSLM